MSRQKPTYEIEGHLIVAGCCVRAGCGVLAADLWADVDCARDSRHVRGSTCLGIDPLRRLS